MGNKFLADPTTLRVKGNEIVEKSREFKNNVNKIYSTINEMVNSNYLDPAARAIAAEIESYRDDMDKMTRVIEDYGNFCMTASTKVVRNQEDIIASIK